MPGSVKKIWQSIEEVLEATLVVTFCAGVLFLLFMIATTDIIREPSQKEILSAISIPLMTMAVGTIYSLPCILIGGLINYTIKTEKNEEQRKLQEGGLLAFGFIIGAVYGLIIHQLLSMIGAACGLYVGYLIKKKNQRANTPAAEITKTLPANGLGSQYLRAVIVTVAAAPVGGLMLSIIYFACFALMAKSYGLLYTNLIISLVFLPAALLYAFPASIIVAAPLAILINKGKWNPLLVITLLIMCSSIPLMLTNVSQYLIIPGAIVTGIIIFSKGEYIRTGMKKTQQAINEIIE